MDVDEITGLRPRAMLSLRNCCASRELAYAHVLAACGGVVYSCSTLCSLIVQCSSCSLLRADQFTELLVTLTRYTVSVQQLRRLFALLQPDNGAWVRVLVYSAPRSPSPSPSSSSSRCSYSSVLLVVASPRARAACRPQLHALPLLHTTPTPRRLQSSRLVSRIIESRAQSVVCLFPALRVSQAPFLRASYSALRYAFILVIVLYTIIVFLLYSRLESRYGLWIWI